MATRAYMENRSGTDAASFGRYLKTIREKQGIAPEVVADAICVSIRQLRYIEAEDHQQLPGEVYTKGMLRAYAREIGVDPEDIIERYKLHRQAHEDALRRESEILAAGSKAFSRSMIALAVLGVIMVLSLYAFSRMESGTVSAPARQQKSQQAPAEQSQRQPSGLADDKAGMPENIAGLEKSRSGLQRLDIDAIDEVTLNVRIDDQPYTKYRLDPNDHVELAAKSGFELLISNAAGVRLRFNGRIVNLGSEPGRSVSIRLPQSNGNR
ncbi:MAG: helix-turn-helix domain-containing protein [Desulfobacteraceae bacterium]|nr:helix-turn-helix domain-containing protein [Desulfobacteraceae bacterium]